MKLIEINADDMMTLRERVQLEILCIEEGSLVKPLVNESAMFSFDLMYSMVIIPLERSCLTVLCL